MPRSHHWQVELRQPRTRQPKVFIWRGSQDTARLADAIAEKTQTELFNVGRSLFRLTEGRLIAVNKDVLRDIINQHIVSLQLVNRRSTNDPL